MERLKNTKLFKGISEKEIENIIKQCNAKFITYKKNEVLVTPREKVKNFGIILSGSVMGVHNDYWGNRTIITVLNEYEMYGESFSFSQKENYNVSVICASDVEALVIDIDKLLEIDNRKIVQNMMMILASKNVYLTRKMDYMSKRTIKNKLLTYLSDEALKHKSNKFVIPFYRQELADYLGVDRSAMSSELGKLKEKGVLNYHKNEFELY